MNPRGFLSRSLLAAPALVAALSFALPAAADVPPPNSCEGSQAGDSCDNAGTDADQPGTCEASTCTELNYSCDGGKGGPCGSSTYSCLVCTAAGSSSTASGESGSATHSRGTGASGSGSETSSFTGLSDQQTSSSSITKLYDSPGTSTGSGANTGGSSGGGTLAGPGKDAASDDNGSSGGCSSSGARSGAMGGLFMMGLVALGIRGRRPPRGVGWSTARSRRRCG